MHNRNARNLTFSRFFSFEAFAASLLLLFLRMDSGTAGNFLDVVFPALPAAASFFAGEVTAVFLTSFLVLQIAHRLTGSTHENIY